MDIQPKYFAAPKRRGKVDLSNSNLQVIVKMANVLLTPEKPEFDLGKWQVEGTRAENIVATGIYCYDSSNVTESALELRMAFDGDAFDDSFPSDSCEEAAHIFGNKIKGNSQLLGRVETPQGRCLAFPNNLQHRVARFELEDKKRSWHQKILTFLLVNPDDRVPSTREVPPQQERMTNGQALEYRQQLMQERSSKAAEATRVLFENDLTLGD